ncbi:MAG: hypothetical protein H6Q26_1875, partial [Bacteroidetes bacterium]|nr:hypothetical protein [Bacteroidota bacterium]
LPQQTLGQIGTQKNEAFSEGKSLIFFAHLALYFPKVTTSLQKEGRRLISVLQTCG